MFLSIHWLLFFCCILHFIQSGYKQKKKRDLFIHTVDDGKYETLLLLVKGKFHVPIVERTGEITEKCRGPVLEKEGTVYSGKRGKSHAIFQRTKGCQKVGGFRSCCKDI